MFFPFSSKCQLSKMMKISLRQYRELHKPAEFYGQARSNTSSDVVKNLSAGRKTVGAMDILEWAGRESGIDEDMLTSEVLGDAQS